MAVISKKPIEGLDQLKAAMKALPAKLQKSVMDATVRGGAKEVGKLYKENLGSGYKTLKRSVKVIKRRSRGRTETKYTVTPTRGKGSANNGWYAHIVERGAQPHEIVPKTRKALKIPGDYYNAGGGLRGSSGYKSQIIKHPGVRPTRAMYRAYKQQSKILAAMVAEGKKHFSKLRIKHGY